MKLYRVSTKYGRSPFQEAAFVEANSPKEAISKFTQDEPDEELRYRATLAELPQYYHEMADYMKTPYIK